VERTRRPRTGVVHVEQAAEMIGNAADRLWEPFDAVRKAFQAAGSPPRIRGGGVDGVLILK
jgi:hypothetical protein